MCLIIVCVFGSCRHASPCDLRVVDDALDPTTCEQVIQRAKALGLQRSTVTDAVATTTRDAARTSSQVFLPDTDPLARLVKRTARDLTSLPESRMEQVQVLHYLPGQEYKPHFDACNDGCDGGRDMPRTATVYVYLNDVEEGGHTRFPNLNASVDPKRGRAVVWRNIDASKANLPCSLHGADPVVRGEKWGCNVWIR